jgi:hypothetical protein
VNIRLYLDEDSMQQALVNALRARGVEVITALETGMIERKDEHHLEYATERGCGYSVSMWGIIFIYIQTFYRKANNMQGSFWRNNNATQWGKSCENYCF